MVQDLEALRRQLNKLAEQRLAVGLDDAEQRRSDELCLEETAQIRRRKPRAADRIGTSNDTTTGGQS
jgi:hypothetical protein